MFYPIGWLISDAVFMAQVFEYYKAAPPSSRRPLSHKPRSPTPLKQTKCLTCLPRRRGSRSQKWVYFWASSCSFVNWAMLCHWKAAHKMSNYIRSLHSKSQRKWTNKDTQRPVDYKFMSLCRRLFRLLRAASYELWVYFESKFITHTISTKTIFTL